MKKIVFSLALIWFTAFSVSAQIKDFANFMNGASVEGGLSDATKLMEGYITPYANALGADLNVGWYNNANVHKLGGFDLTLTMNIGLVPDAAKTFDLSTLGLTGVPSAPIAPTAAGAKEAGPEINYAGLPGYNTPKGSGVAFFPLPMLKASLGLIKETELLVRYLPPISFKETGKIGMWGVGFKHSLKQWIPVLKNVPLVHLSLMAGYTQLDVNSPITFLPPAASYPGAPDQASLARDDQSFNLSVSGMTANLIASVNLPFICIYGAAGFAGTQANMQLLGTYAVNSLTSPDGYVEFTDPLDFKVEETSGLSPRLNAGIRFKFGIMTLHFDYTKANYSVASAGIGISFR